MGTNSNKNITHYQIKILDIIENFTSINGFAPTVREIAKYAGLKSTSTVQGHLDKLEQAGYIKRNKLMPRTIKVVVGYNPTTDLRERELFRRIDVDI